MDKRTMIGLRLALANPCLAQLVAPVKLAQKCKNGDRALLPFATAAAIALYTEFWALRS